MNISTETMQIELDVKELEYIYESLSFRLEHDNHLMYHPDIRKDLEDMMAVSYTHLTLPTIYSV